MLFIPEKTAANLLMMFCFILGSSFTVAGITREDVIGMLATFGYSSLPSHQHSELEQHVIPAIIEAIDANSTTPQKDQKRLKQLCSYAVAQIKKGMTGINIKFIVQNSSTLEAFIQDTPQEKSTQHILQAKDVDPFVFWKESLVNTLQTFSSNPRYPNKDIISELEAHGMLFIEDGRVTQVSKTFIGWMRAPWLRMFSSEKELTAEVSQIFPGLPSVIKTWAVHTKPHIIGMLNCASTHDPFVYCSLRYIASTCFLQKRHRLISLLNESLHEIRQQENIQTAIYGSFAIWLHNQHITQMAGSPNGERVAFDDIDLVVESTKHAEALADNFKEKTCSEYSKSNLCCGVDFDINVYRTDPIPGKNFEYQTIILTVMERVGREKTTTPVWLLSVDISLNPEKLQSSTEGLVVSIELESVTGLPAQKWPVFSLQQLLDYTQKDRHSDQDCAQSQKLLLRTSRAQDRIQLLERLLERYNELSGQTQQPHPVENDTNTDVTLASASVQEVPVASPCLSAMLIDDQTLTELIEQDDPEPATSHPATKEKNEWLEGMLTPSQASGKNKGRHKGNKGKKGSQKKQQKKSATDMTGINESEHRLLDTDSTPSSAKQKMITRTKPVEVLSEEEYQHQRREMGKQADDLFCMAESLPKDTGTIAATSPEITFDRLNELYRQLVEFSDQYPDRFFNQQTLTGKGTAPNVQSHRFKFHAGVLVPARHLLQGAQEFFNHLEEFEYLNKSNIQKLIEAGNIVIHAGALYHTHFGCGLEFSAKDMRLNKLSKPDDNTHPSIYLIFIYSRLAKRYNETDRSERCAFLTTWQKVWQEALKPLDDLHFNPNLKPAEYPLPDARLVLKPMAQACRLLLLTLIRPCSDHLVQAMELIDLWLRQESEFKALAGNQKDYVEITLSALNTSLLNLTEWQSHNIASLEEEEDFGAAQAFVTKLSALSSRSQYPVLQSLSKQLTVQTKALQDRQDIFHQRQQDAQREAKQAFDWLMNEVDKRDKELKAAQEQIEELQAKLKAERNSRLWADKKHKIEVRKAEEKERHAAEVSQQHLELAARNLWDDTLEGARTHRREGNYKRALEYYQQLDDILEKIPPGEANPRPFFLIEAADNERLDIREALSQLIIQVSKIKRYHHAFQKACDELSDGKDKSRTGFSAEELYDCITKYNTEAETIIPALCKILEKQESAMSLLLESQRCCMVYQNRQELDLHIQFLKMAKTSLNDTNNQLFEGYNTIGKTLQLRQQWFALQKAASLRKAAHHYSQSESATVNASNRSITTTKAITTANQPSHTLSAFTPRQSAKPSSSGGTTLPYNYIQGRSLPEPSQNNIVSPPSQQKMLELKKLFGHLKQLKRSLDNMQDQMKASQHTYEKLIHEYGTVQSQD